MDCEGRLGGLNAKGCSLLHAKVGLKPNVTPPLMIGSSIVYLFFVIQDPVTVLGVRYCGIVAPSPKKSQKKWYRLVCFKLSGLGRLRSGSG